MKEKLQLTLHASGLTNVARALKTSDPFAIVTLLGSGPGEKPRILGKTEVIKNNLSPKWTTSFLFDYECGKETHINVSIFDEGRKHSDKPMGSAVFEIGYLLRNQGSIKAQELNEGGILYARLRKQIATNSGSLTLCLRGIKLKNVEELRLFKRSDPFYELRRTYDSPSGGAWTTVYRSKQVKDNLDPKWEPTTIDVNTLCDGDLGRWVQVAVFDWERNGKHESMGTFETTVNGLLKAAERKGAFTPKRGLQIMGTIVVDQAKITGAERLQHTTTVSLAADSPLPQSVPVPVAQLGNMSSSGGQMPTFVDHVSEGWTKKEGETEDGSTPPNHRRKDSFPPLKDDPNYNKYFKMLKAKLPLPWVKRILEADGKDARVLDLDPDKPLAEQIAGAGVDESGNVDWSKVVVFRTSVESEWGEIIGKIDRRGDGAMAASSNASDIHLETAASVKAKLAIMTAKAGLSSKGSLNFGQSGFMFDAKERKPRIADITTAVAAASKARLERLDRLRAMTTSDRSGNWKKTVDEIRQRPPAVPPRTPKQTVASPTTATVASNDKSECASVSRMQNYDHLPLKDDPRFAKYFQMIRSRVPRAWVERVIEVDDIDPAILDLDPNKPLAAQVEDEDLKSLVKTIATEDGSLDDSMHSSGSDMSTSRSSLTNPALSTTIDARSPTEELPESHKGDLALDEILAGAEVVPPITQIKTAAFDDNRSVASSITNFKDGPGSQAVQLNVVFDAFLEKIEARTKSLAETPDEEEPTDVRQPPRFSSQEDIERKLANLLQRYGTKAEADTSLEEVQSDAKDERRQFLEDHHSDIAKLSALLAAKLGQQPDAFGSANLGQTPTEEQAELAKLSSLLTEVLSKMDVPTSDEQEAPDPAANDSAPKKLRKNSALEAMFAKRNPPTVEQSQSHDGSKVEEENLDPRAALNTMFAKRNAPLIESHDESKSEDVDAQLDPRAALDAMFAKRHPPPADEPKPSVDDVADTARRSAPPVEQPQSHDEGKSEDAGVQPDPRAALNALLSKQVAPAEERGDPILGEDPEYQKYFKMQKLGLPRPTIEQALERDGKDVSILDLDPDLPLAEQKNKKPNKNAALEALFANRAAALKPKEHDVPLKNDPEYQKYFKMLKVGMPRDTVAQALERDGKSASVLDLDLEKPYASQMKKESVDEARDEVEEKISDPALKDDPEYAKFFKMLKMGIPLGAVKQALQKEGKDPSVIDLDPEKSYLSQAKDKTESKAEIPLKDDPEYAKFFKMLKMGIPLGAVKQALQKEGKDPSIIDLDPEKSYSSQVKDEAVDVAELPLKDDPEYAKFFKMLKMGIPLGAVKQALQKEGKDPSVIDLDPEKSYSSQAKDKTKSKVEVPLKDDPEYAKFFMMLKMGIPIPAVKQALQKEGKDPNIIDMDPDKPLSQIKSEVPLKDDPEYAKFFKMLKMGIPLPAVKQAMQKEGKDPNIIDMDPEKPLSQTKAEVPLKDDPEYAKFFKMLKMGIPLPAVKQALQKEGKDPSIIDMDPEKPLSQQQSGSKQAKPTKVNNAPKVARKRLHWNKIDESKLNENCFWSQAKGEHASLQLVGLDIDNEEFDALFTSSVNKSAALKKDNESEAKTPVGKQKIQLIDGRRRMNGSILLKKFKVDFKVLARQVDNMEYVEAEGNELRGLMQLLPTKDESLALRSYLPPVDAPQAEIDEAIDKLGECEQYMATMLDIPDAKAKFQCMLFRAEFEQHVDSIRDGTKLLIVACESVQNSERFKKLLMYALKLGNAMNTGGSEVSAITLDSLLKLAEAKAFDRQTSVLHYLVSIVSKNDEDVLRLSEDFGPVKAAERVAVDMLSQQLKELANGSELIKQMTIKYAPDSEKSCDNAEDEPTDDKLLSVTPMGKFSLTSESKITSLMNEFGGAKSSFADLLEFFGEDETLTTEAFFCTINTFVAMFDQTYKELKRKEEAKDRKKRIEEKRKLREGAMKQVKATS